MGPRQVGSGAVGKRLVDEERRVSIPRAVATGAGGGLLAYGLSRSPAVGRALAHGVRIATEKDNRNAIRALELAQGLRGVAREGTGRVGSHVRQIKRLNDTIDRVPPSMRPGVAIAAGALLVDVAHPVRRTTYRPVVAPGMGWY